MSQFSFGSLVQTVKAGNAVLAVIFVQAFGRFDEPQPYQLTVPIEFGIKGKNTTTERARLIDVATVVVA